MPRGVPAHHATQGGIMNTVTTSRPGAGTAAGRASEAPLAYQSGFGNEFATESLEGALPVGQNSPPR